jgi:hypothetical protein
MSFWGPTSSSTYCLSGNVSQIAPVSITMYAIPCHLLSLPPWSPSKFPTLRSLWATVRQLSDGADRYCRSAPMTDTTSILTFQPQPVVIEYRWYWPDVIRIEKFSIGRFIKCYSSSYQKETRQFMDNVFLKTNVITVNFNFNWKGLLTEKKQQVSCDFNCNWLALNNCNCNCNWNTISA